jgi:hypothetical protein
MCVIYNYKTMEILRGFFILIFMVGLIMLVGYFIIKSELSSCDSKIIYKYIPRTLADSEKEPVFVSQIFKTMFTQPSVWIDSIYDDSHRLLRPMNEYNISQM